MKNAFKLLLSILFILVVIASGCSEKESNVSGEKEKINFEEKLIIRLLTDNVEYSIDFGQYAESWRDKILEEFNIDVKLDIITIDDLINLNWYEAIYSNDIFIREYGKVFSDNIYPYRKDNVIQPFNHYLSESLTWSTLPDLFKSSYMDNSGAVWAIPYSDHITMFGRAVSKEWMYNTNLEIPQTVNGLYDMFQKFTYGDPDKNGADDTKGAIISLKKGMLEFKDIFEANGCYLTYQTNTLKETNREIYFSVPVGYNPKTGMIEDCINQPGMIESLEFIESLVSNKLISVGENKIVNREFLFKNVGMYVHIIKDMELFDNFEYILALTGLNTQYTSSLFLDGEGAYFLSAKANNPELIVPAFIDTFYGSEDGYKLGHYGILGSQYKYSETKYGIIANDTEEKMTPHIELVGELTWRLPSDEETMEGRKKIDVDDLYKDDRFFLINQKCMAFGERTLEVLLGDEESGINYQKKISNLFRLLYTGEISAIDVIAEMNRIHSYYDINRQINEINSRWFGK